MHYMKNCSKVAALACALSAVACGGQEADRPVSTAMSALENPIAACQAQLASCQGGPGSNSCTERMRTCLTNYAEWLRAMREGIALCRTDAGLCVAGGRTGMQCRDTYNQCITALWTNDSGEDGGVADDDAGTSHAAGAGGRSGRGPRAGSGGTSGAGGRGGPFGGGFPAPGSNGGRVPGRAGAGGASGGAGAGVAAGSGAPGFPPPGLPGQGQGQGQAGRGQGQAGRGQVPGQGGPGFGASVVSPEAACMDHLAQCMTSGRDLAECADDARQCLRTDPIGALLRP
jgi:hypothetical protein